MARGGNGIGGFGAGAKKMGGMGLKPPTPKAPTSKGMPPGAGGMPPMGPSSGSPAGAFKKGGVVGKGGKSSKADKKR